MSFSSSCKTRTHVYTHTHMVAHRHLLPHDSSTAVPPTIGSTKGGALQNGAMHLDTNMVIILAALLCALLCALGLNSIVRGALRSTGTFPHESANEVSAHFSLGQEELSRLPVVAYKSGGLHIQATDCAICLGEFVEGEEATVDRLIGDYEGVEKSLFNLFCHGSNFECPISSTFDLCYYYCLAGQ